MTKFLFTLSFILLGISSFAQNIIEDEMRCPSKEKEALIAYSIGTNAFKKRDYITAVAYLDKAIKIDSTFCDAWNNLGVSCRYLGKWESGYWALIRGIMLDSTHHVSWLNMSEHMMVVGDTANAIRSINNLLRNSPNNPYGLTALGKLYYNIADYDSSMIYLKQVLALKHNHEAELLKAYNHYELKEYPEFKALADSLYIKDKKDALLNFYFGRYYDMENDKKLSKKFYREAEKLGITVKK